MKKIFLLLFLLGLFGPKSVFACDSCNFFEYSLLQNKSYFGLFYRFRDFQQYKQYPTTVSQSIKSYPAQMSTRFFPGESATIMHEPEANGLYVQKSKRDFENYQTIEARGNVTLNYRWNLTFLLPYEMNKVYYEKYLDLPNPQRDTTIYVQGWGDLTLATEYIHLIYGKNSRHTLRPGFALTLPTGQALVRSGNESKDYFDPIIQPGKNAFSFTPRVNYQWFRENQGINAGLSYQWSTEGAQDYQMGNSLNTYALYFHQLQLGENWILAPNAGMYYEQSKEDRNQGVKQALTGGQVAFAQMGLDLNWTRTTFSLVYQTPFYQELNGNQILNQDRFSIGLIRSFKL